MTNNSIRNYYLNGSKEIFTQRVFSEPKFDKYSRNINKPEDCNIGNSLLTSNNSKQMMNSVEKLPPLSIIHSPKNAISRIKWNQKLGKICTKIIKSKDLYFSS